ncbi:MAG: hypothetical protein BROFUL_02785 [Candidatus Brocadia fulgida]|jgi:hypothetical protein|uniref:Uncharacterized protein n=1 Tax=Candidatus Brocadia fulgida TaxID=380242 RepID=A0A0M2US98_9BACT|nr:MAG: hypothetical protein BROFUL_02785 [Candidatus Brocadia fulgida]
MPLVISRGNLKDSGALGERVLKKRRLPANLMHYDVPFSGMR